jgi:hypothetical protein
MKTLLLMIAGLIAVQAAVARQEVSCLYTEIKQVQYDTCQKVPYLVDNSKIKKQAGKLVIPISGKPAKVFKDDKEDNNFEEFSYLGDIKGTVFCLIMKSEYEGEEFYLVNRSTGSIDTLIGKPVFASNRSDFACLNNPGTDQQQYIQVGQMKNGVIRTRAYLNAKEGAFLETITGIGRNTLLAKDNQGKYYRLIFQMAGK